MRQYMLVSINKILRKAFITDRLLTKTVKVKYKNKIYNGCLRLLATSIPKDMLSKYYLVIPLREEEIKLLDNDILEIRVFRINKTQIK